MSLEGRVRVLRHSSVYIRFALCACTVFWIFFFLFSCSASCSFVMCSSEVVWVLRHWLRITSSFTESSSFSILSSIEFVCVATLWRCCTFAMVSSVLVLVRISTYLVFSVSSAPSVAHVAKALIPRGNTPFCRHSSLKAKWCRANS